MDDDMIVVEAERRQITKVGRSKWYQLEDEGLAPHRRQITGKRTGWLRSELLEWVRSRPIARNAPPREALAARGLVPSDQDAA